MTSSVPSFTPLQQRMMELLHAHPTMDLAHLMAHAIHAQYGPADTVAESEAQFREALRDIKSLEAHGLVDSGGRLV